MFVSIKLSNVTLSEEFLEDSPGVGTRHDINRVGHCEWWVKWVRGEFKAKSKFGRNPMGVHLSLIWVYISRISSLTYATSHWTRLKLSPTNTPPICCPTCSFSIMPLQSEWCDLCPINESLLFSLVSFLTHLSHKSFYAFVMIFPLYIITPIFIHLDQPIHCVTFSDFKPFFSWLSPKRPSTCQHEDIS